MKALKSLTIALVCLVGVSTSGIHAAVNPVVAEMALAANNFLAALDGWQKSIATFEFKADERHNWHFIPKERKGLAWNQMTGEQKELAHALLGTSTSHRGHLKSVTIMSLEKILQISEGPDRRFSRDPELYHVSIFGKPSSKGTWGWRIEGHHLSLNFTIVNGNLIAATPSFYGANPAEVREGPRKGLRVLAAEEDLARKLVKSLNSGQLKKALVGDEAPRDIFTSADRKVEPLGHKGLPAGEMTDEQKESLMALIEEYVFRNRAGIGKVDLDLIEEAGIDNIHFAWMGGLNRGDAHYYSVQGPTFLLEYDNIQNNANHIHATWRDFKNDFGEDLLKQHYSLYHR